MASLVFLHYILITNNLYLCKRGQNVILILMCKEKLFIGVSVKVQMDKAREILENQVIPREKLFQQRKRQGLLGQEVRETIKVNA